MKYLSLILLIVFVGCEVAPNHKDDLETKVYLHQYDSLDKSFIRALYKNGYLNGLIDGRKEVNNWTADSLNLEKTLSSYYNK